MPLKSKKVDEGEVTKNAQLAEALREPLVVAGVSTVLCQPVRRPDRRHPDILIANDDGQEVVVECKQDDPQLARAKADAMGRLATGDKIIGLAAVSYNGSESASNLNWAFRAAKAPDWEGVIRGSNDLELRLRIEQAFFPKRLEVGQSIARIRAAVDQFTATCADMPGVADGLAKALKVDYKRADGDKKAKLRREMPVVAGLVLMQAMIFHRLLAQASAEEFEELGGGTISDLGGLEEGAGARELRSAWREIQKVNYVAIFSLAEKLLANCAGIFPRKSVAMFSEVADACLDHAKAGNDFAGSIFHRYLADQKTLAAYYTSNAAATLLAGLMFDAPGRLPKNALRSAKEFEKVTVMDPACGTGTLLLAAAARLRELSEIGKSDFHRILMENVVKGMDVLDVGVSMAAAALGMMSPTVQFKHCGVRAVDMRADGKRGAVLGSLQWLNDHNLLNLDLAILRNIETGGSAPADAALGEVSAVIMNPPFAVGQDGNTSFSFLDSKRDEEKMKRAYAERGRQYGFGSGAGAGPGFLQLAAKRVAEGGRFGTIIGVALGTGSKAYGRARRNLSRYFDIDTVIISRDPKRINFSDSTNLNEIMVVGTRNDTPFVEKKDAPAPAREAASRKAAFVVLTRNPATPSKAKQLARLISNIDRSAPRGVIQGFGEYVMDEVRDAASWDILNFSNPDLSMFLRKASAGNLSGMLTGSIPMLVGGVGGDEAKLGIRGCYRLDHHTEKRCAPDTDTDRRERERGSLFLTVADKGKGQYAAIWEGCPDKTYGGYFVKPNRERMVQKPNVWMNPRPGCEDKAREYFKGGGFFGIRRTFRVNTSHALAAVFTEPLLSCTFLPLTLRDDEDGAKTKAMVAWLNSSLGTALIVKHSTVAAEAKVMFSGHGVKTMAWLDVSRLEPERIAALAAAYDAMVADEKAGRTLGRIGNIAKDPQRAKLDGLAARALGIKGDFGRLRDLMAREMIFTGAERGGSDEDEAVFP